MVCALLFHSLDFFSFFFYPIKLFLFNLLDLNERLLLVDNFLFAHSWRGKSWPSISLSMKDYGAASRAAKSPLRTLLFWKTSGISSFQDASVLFFGGLDFLQISFHIASLLKDIGLGSETSSPWRSCWCWWGILRFFWRRLELMKDLYGREVPKSWKYEIVKDSR